MNSHGGDDPKGAGAGGVRQILRDVAGNVRGLPPLLRPRVRGEQRRMERVLRNLRTGKQSQDVFILGSGPSVLELGHTEWHHIRQSVSIATGMWIFHPFAPDVYYFEGNSDQEGADWWKQIFRERKENYRDTVLVLPRREFSRRRGSRALAELECEWPGMSFGIEPHYVKARSSNMLSMVMAARRWLGLEQFIPHVRSSLSVALFLGTHVLECERVVLVGVDLVGGYFWHAQGIPYRSGMNDAGRIHQTAATVGGTLSITDYLRWFIESGYANGVEILTGSATSPLSDYLNIWDGP